MPAVDLLPREATPISRGHSGVPCGGDPASGGTNQCPSPATQFVLTQGMVRTKDGGSDLGWILISFCDRHKRVILDHLRPRVGFLGQDSIVAEIAALPMALRDVVGIDAAIEGLDAGVATNVFQRAVG